MSFVIERMHSDTDLDAVLEVEQASFNNPTTRVVRQRIATA